MWVGIQLSYMFVEIKNNIVELVFSFYLHVGSRDGTQVARPVLFTWSHLSDPGHSSYNDILFFSYHSLSFSHSLCPLVLYQANNLLNILVWCLVQTDIHAL